VAAVIANLWTSYLFSIAGISGFHIGGGLNYQGKSYSDITNVNSIPPYLIANAAFGYEATHWGIDVNVHNITNERYFIAANAGGCARWPAAERHGHSPRELLTWAQPKSTAARPMR
jgi:iron complex outermembrane receptor protein